METNEDIFGGFSSIANDLSGKTNGVDDLSNGPIGNDPIRKPPVAQADLDDDDDDNDDVELDEDGNPIVPGDEDDDDLDDDDDDLTEEEKAAIELAKNKGKKKSTKKPKQTTTDDDDDDDDEEDGLGDAEPEMAEYLQEKIFDKFNLDIEDESFEKFTSINDVVNFVEEAIKVNSIPTFATDEVANIDTYVRNGGDLNSYMQNVYGGVNLDTIDLDNEETQKALIKQDMINQGISENRIAKRIERMEDMGMLKEEAEDAKESLSEFKAQNEKRLLEDQKKQKQLAEEANLEFVNSVETELDAMSTVRGIPLTKAEKDKLYNYMLRPTAEGIPQYHIDYRKNRKNMIESAYFTMMGDKLVQKVQKKAKSNATKKLKDKLADKGNRGKNQSDTGSGTSDVWSMISKTLR